MPPLNNLRSIGEHANGVSRNLNQSLESPSKRFMFVPMNIYGESCCSYRLESCARGVFINVEPTIITCCFEPFNKSLRGCHNQRMYASVKFLAKALVQHLFFLFGL